MKRKHYKAYIASGITAFCVIAGAIFLFFGLYHWPVVYAFLKSTARILRPIFMGMVIAFLLLFAVVGFVCVIFTYIGVNTLLPGVHSYK